MNIVFESVTKKFQHRPSLFNLLGRETPGTTVALDNVSATVPQGQVLVLLGENGSGKTTLLKLIATMLLPDAGRILVRGNDSRTAGAIIRREVGFAVAAERSFFPRLTARENLAFFAALEEVARAERAGVVERVLELVGLTAAGDRLVMQFSTGMYQRLGIARALLKSPRILLLDEPTRSLDPGAAEHLWSWLRAAVADGTTAVLATHSFEEAVAAGDSAILLRAGRLRGHADIGGSTSAEQLRQFYFSQDEEAVSAGESRP